MFEFMEEYRLLGIGVGMATFVIIGLFHPAVVKAEYYWGSGCWWVFLLAGAAGLAGSVLAGNLFVSVLCGVFAFSSLWSIKELLQQRKRVEKGWFPENPRRKKR